MLDDDVNLYLDEQLKSFFSTTQPLFDQLMRLRGESFRQQKGRLTQRVVMGEKAYFIKQHTGVGWKEIIKNIVQFRWPVLSAQNEWKAINKLKSLGVSVPSVVGYGLRGKNPAKQESFVLMEALAPVISLEDLCKTWQTTPPAFRLKMQLLREVARIARLLHENGMNHRDFYICHFLLDKRELELVNRLTLYLIDLHRADIRGKTPERWVVKDLAGLYFSSKDIGLTQRDLYRFMQWYRNARLRDIMKTDTNIWQKVKKRGEQLYRDHTK